MSVEDLAKRARAAARLLAVATRAQKDAALQAIAEGLLARADEVLSANHADLETGRASGLSPALLDRLELNAERIEAIAHGALQVAALEDPVGEVIRSSTTTDGLRLEQVRVPFGVVGIIYEARPNVTVDAAVICLKSGNAVLLRGSSTTMQTNAVLVEIMRSALAKTGLPKDAIQMVPADDRENVQAMLKARGLIDLVIPRGGAALIETVVRDATVPVIETGVGNCHVFIDREADLTKALPIVINAKVSRPSVCNAAETLLVHADVAAEFLPPILAALAAEGVRLHADPATISFADAAGIATEPASDADWFTEYGTLDLAVAVVSDLDHAIEHIRTYGSGHTEAIVTEDPTAARQFIAGCDSAAVMVNASTRFTDGERFGFGAEIGISTQKLHARGPMALPEMTTTTWVVTGDGQVRN